MAALLRTFVTLSFYTALQHFKVLLLSIQQLLLGKSLSCFFFGTETSLEAVTGEFALGIDNSRDIQYLSWVQIILRFIRVWSRYVYGCINMKCKVDTSTNTFSSSVSLGRSLSPWDMLGLFLDRLAAFVVFLNSQFGFPWCLAFMMVRFLLISAHRFFFQ